MKNHINHLVATIRTRGLRFLYVYAKEAMIWDLQHRTDTCLRVPKQQKPGLMGAEFHDGILYVASFTSVIRRTVGITKAYLGFEQFADYQFVDLGCGKGKALFVYIKDHGKEARYPAIGIEYDYNLAESARNNTRRMGIPSEKVIIGHDTATNVKQWIGAEKLIVYLYNPFQGATLRRTLDAIADLPHILIYIDPAEEGILSDFGYENICSYKGRYNADTWLVAKSKHIAS